MPGQRLALVTGGPGFIGRRVVARLLEAGWRVRSFSLPGEPEPTGWKGRAQMMFGDIANEHDVRVAAAAAGRCVPLLRRPVGADQDPAAAAALPLRADGPSADRQLMIKAQSRAPDRASAPPSVALRVDRESLPKARRIACETKPSQPGRSQAPQCPAHRRARRLAFDRQTRDDLPRRRNRKRTNPHSPRLHNAFSCPRRSSTPANRAMTDAAAGPASKNAQESPPAIARVASGRL